MTWPWCDITSHFDAPMVADQRGESFGGGAGGGQATGASFAYRRDTPKISYLGSLNQSRHQTKRSWNARAGAPKRSAIIWSVHPSGSVRDFLQCVDTDVRPDDTSGPAVGARKELQIHYLQVL